MNTKIKITNYANRLTITRQVRYILTHMTQYDTMNTVYFSLNKKTAMQDQNEIFT